MPVRVLIVEDEPNIIESLSFILEREGCSITTELDGVAGLERLRKDVPDVLILDVMLPKLDGFQVLKQIRADSNLANLPILMLTAKGQQKDRQTADDLGVSAFITKPFSNQEVVELVMKLAATV
jgi:DNA-binding response OmpR family regulator